MNTKLIEGSRSSPLDDQSPASGLKVMDPEIQTLQEHGCRAPVSLAQKSFSWKVETVLSDRHSIPALNLQKYNLRSSPVIRHALMSTWRTQRIGREGQGSLLWRGSECRQKKTLIGNMQTSARTASFPDSELPRESDQTLHNPIPSIYGIQQCKPNRHCKILNRKIGRAPLW